MNQLFESEEINNKPFADEILSILKNQIIKKVPQYFPGYTEEGFNEFEKEFRDHLVTTITKHGYTTNLVALFANMVNYIKEIAGIDSETSLDDLGKKLAKHRLVPYRLDSSIPQAILYTALHNLGMSRTTHVMPTYMTTDGPYPWMGTAELLSDLVTAVGQNKIDIFRAKNKLTKGQVVALILQNSKLFDVTNSGLLQWIRQIK